jgi:two-component system sensor histidine kinase HydH
MPRVPAGAARAAALAALRRCNAATHACNATAATPARRRGPRARALLYPAGMGLRRHWDLVGLAAGAAIGIADYGLFLAMGSPEIEPLPPELFAGGLALVFGGLGFAVGRLALARQRARRDADTIARQLRALEEAQRTLLQQEKLAAVGRLAAGVAHEVRNPLGVIRASASLLREGFPPGGDAYRACGFICEEIDRLNALITALLGFSRPAEPKLVPVSIDGVLDRALQLAGEAVRRPGLALWREGDGASPELRADPDLLAQVLLDLVINAAEAVGEPGRIAIRVGGDEDWLRVEVADDGPGVAPERASEIFEPFVTSKARGTGLGLAMALRIAETHRGRLELVPGAGAGAGGAGACFRLSVPRGTAGGE